MLPALAKSKVGSSRGTAGLEGTTTWSLEAKKERKVSLTRFAGHSCAGGAWRLPSSAGSPWSCCGCEGWMPGIPEGNRDLPHFFSFLPSSPVFFFFSFFSFSFFLSFFLSLSSLLSLSFFLLRDTNSLYHSVPWSADINRCRNCVMRIWWEKKTAKNWKSIFVFFFRNISINQSINQSKQASNQWRWRWWWWWALTISDTTLFFLCVCTLNLSPCA